MELEPDAPAPATDTSLETLLDALEAADPVRAAEPASELARALERELDQE